MEDQQKNPAAEAAAPQVERQAASIDVEEEPAGRDQAGDADVAKDEQEAMRRAELPNPNDEPPEAKDPQVAEIESIIASIRH